MLEVVNLGDSGVRVLRGGAVLWRSTVLQHEWNMPFQLGNPALLPETDSALDAASDVVQCAPGDVVVMGSDGLFDNVWDKELCEIADAVRQSAPSDVWTEAQVGVLAQRIALTAEAHSVDKLYKSPWSVECAENKAVGILRRFFPRGGKLDDITVVAAVVV